MLVLEMAKKRLVASLYNYYSLISAIIYLARMLPILGGLLLPLSFLGLGFPTGIAVSISSSSRSGFGIICSKSLGLFLRKVIHWLHLRSFSSLKGPRPTRAGSLATCSTESVYCKSPPYKSFSPAYTFSLSSLLTMSSAKKPSEFLR